jgi:hypothetical protein
MMMSETVFLGECPVIKPEGIYFGGRRVIRLGLSAVERTNPLPVGKYWVDVFEPQESAFLDWLRRNKTNVAVTSTESFDAAGDYPARVWRLFEVNAPVPWEGPGLPTIAGPNVKSSADTSDRPPPTKDPLDKLSDYGTNVEKTAKTILWVAGGVAAVVVTGVLVVRYMPRQSTPSAPPLGPV